MRVTEALVGLLDAGNRGMNGGSGFECTLGPGTAATMPANKTTSEIMCAKCISKAKTETIQRFFFSSYLDMCRYVSPSSFSDDHKYRKTDKALYKFLLRGLACARFKLNRIDMPRLSRCDGPKLKGNTHLPIQGTKGYLPRNIYT